MHYRHANRIIKPKPYTPAIYSDIRRTLRDAAPMHPVKLATVVLKYPIRGQK